MQIRIEKPRLGVPAGLIVDDPAPCINPFYYYRLQVDHEGWQRHEQRIPLDFLHQFAGLCQAQGMRGKFSVLPYPAGLGSILDGWDGCDHAELAAWLALVRAEIAPAFDITPEILTHTLALDLRTHALLPEAEHDWMATRSVDELREYFGVALAILRQAGFQPTGITQPVAFAGSRAAYAQAVLEAMREIGGPPITFYFIDGCFDLPPLPEHEVVLLDRARGEAVVSIFAYCNDAFWPTQRVTSQRAEQVVDELITADASSGRLVQLAAAQNWLTLVCHWQTLFSDGSRAGLQALAFAVERLERAYGPRLHWMPLSEIARYRAASEACRIAARLADEGWMIELESAFECPDFTLSLPCAAGTNADAQIVLHAQGHGKLLRRQHAAGLLGAHSWRYEAGRASLCFDLQRGRQVLTLGFGR